MAWRAAVGDDGTIVETFADNSWKASRLGDDDLYAVSCVNNQVGWAVGSRGSIFHTQDGGQSWWPQSSGFSDDLLATAFAIDASGAYVGIITGHEGALGVTRDGSVSWHAIEASVEGALRGAATTRGATLLLASGDGGIVLRSEDAGVAWSRTAIEGAGDLRDIAADAAGALVLTVDDRGAIWASRDRGQSFALETQAEVPLESVSIGYDGAWSIAAGEGGVALVRDAAGSWTSANTATEATLHAALVAPNGEHFYVAGDAGTLLESQDHGRSFYRTEISSSVSVALRGIEDLSAR
jgi:photosystem II stability/assembly factor-like uncharacterized protein